MGIAYWIAGTSLSVYLACKFSRKFKYYFKFTLFTILALVNGTIFVPLMVHRPKDSRNGLLPSWGVRECCRLLLGVTYEVRGRENVLPEGQGCVLLMNHQTALDLLVMANIWRYTPNGRMIAKKEILWLVPFGPATWFWGTVFLDRLNPEKSHKTLNRTGELINDDKARIVMFPEGTRHMGEDFLPFKKGAFHIAVAAQCPIQPVAVSRYHFLDSDTYTFDPGHSIIEILPPISTKGLKREDIPDLIEKTRKVMKEGFDRISKDANKIWIQQNKNKTHQL